VFRRNAGRVEIQKKEAFCLLVRECPFTADESISALLVRWDTYVRIQEPSVTNGALSNCHGDWYEWILAIAAWNQKIASNSNRLAVLLPNVMSFDANTLYHTEIYELVEDLKRKVRATTHVEFITSNPDFVMFRQDDFEPSFNVAIDLNTITVQSLNILDEAYRHFVGLLDFTDLLAYASVKTSLRPDRRLQISHEGSLVKAIHQHIITRKWIINPNPLRYYAISTSVGVPDRTGLKTIATHSIITVNQVPVSAVDEVYEIDTYNAALTLFETLYRI
jgi:hypothetical protein